MIKLLTVWLVHFLYAPWDSINGRRHFLINYYNILQAKLDLIGHMKKKEQRKCFTPNIQAMSTWA